MKLHTHEEMLNTVIGKKGTAARIEFEARLKAEIEAYQIGEAIKQTRQQQNLTQKQLGERMGVQDQRLKVARALPSPPSLEHSRLWVSRPQPWT